MPAIAVESVEYWLQNSEEWSNVNNNPSTPQAIATKAPLRVTGRVWDDETGIAMPGVTVNEKFTTNGVITNIMGDYTINVLTGNSILVFSFVGYDAQSINVAGRNTINVPLVETPFSETTWGRVTRVVAHDVVGGLIGFFMGAVPGAIASGVSNSATATIWL